MEKIAVLLTVVSVLAIASALPGEKLKKYCAETHVANVGRVRRIIGGEDAALKEFPHMVALIYEEPTGKIGLCAGSLITDKYVLTAATCNTVKIPKYARLGDLNFNGDTDNANAVEVKLARIINHPEFNTKTLLNDIALIELETPVKFNDFIGPACLSTETAASEENQSLVITGWGKTETNRYPPLQKATLNVQSFAKCREIYNRSRVVIHEDQQLCASGDKKDSCTGDTGGPLQKLNPEYLSTYDIVGITSYGPVPCTYIPSIYTKVSYYIGWIESIVLS